MKDHYLSAFLEQNLDAMSHAIEMLKEFIKRWDFSINQILMDIDNYAEEIELNCEEKNKITIYIVNKYNLNNYFLNNDKYVDILQHFYSLNSNVDYKMLNFLPLEMVILNNIKNIWN